MFWFKKKKIILDCFTTDPFSYEFAPISPATKYYPNWWQELPSSHHVMDNDQQMREFVTMRHCRGFTDLFKSSYIMPFWGHLEILLNEEQHLYKWITNFGLGEGIKQVGEHSRNQFPGFVDEKFQHLKLTTPWFFRTNRFVKFIMTDPSWCRKDLTSYSVLSGVVDYKYQTGANINLMAEYKNGERSIKFEPGDPVAMLTPLTEEDVDLKCHLVTERELEKEIPFHRLYTNEKGSSLKQRYSATKLFIQEHDNRNKPRCPFGFGK